MLRALALWTGLALGTSAWALDGWGLYLEGDQILIPGPQVMVVGPRAQLEQVRRYAGYANTWYPWLAQEMGYTIREPLWVVFSTHSDDHNGFSAQIPRPLVQVELAPAGWSPLANGDAQIARTLLHELAHHVSNDRGPGEAWRRIFGRVDPSSALTLFMAYMTIPPAATAPRFWTEGFGQYIETAAQLPKLSWQGRGLDQRQRALRRNAVLAQGKVPELYTWRSSYPVWPFGNMPYIWGLAYWMDLMQQFPERGARPWLDAVAQQEPFRFFRSGFLVNGTSHETLIAQARERIFQQIQAEAAVLASEPETPVSALASDIFAGIPTWDPDGNLLWRGRTAFSLPHWYQRSAEHGKIRAGERASHINAPVSIAPDGSRLWGEFDRFGQLQYTFAYPQGAGAARAALAWQAREAAHWMQGADDYLLARVERFGSQQRLVVHEHWQPGKPLPQGSSWDLPGNAWMPSWASVDGQAWLLWVQADGEGARLYGWSGGEAHMLHQQAEMMWYPRLDAQGYVWWCDDRSGVSNAYRAKLPSLPAQGELVRETMTHRRDWVSAAIPGPDHQVALVIEDATGPHVVLAQGLQPRRAPPQLPPLVAPAPLQIPQPDESTLLPDQPYHPFHWMRLQYWTPTDEVVPAGGFGLLAWWADPLQQRRIQMSLGMMKSEYVGQGRLVYDGNTHATEISGLQQIEIYADGQEAIRRQRGELLFTKPLSDWRSAASWRAFIAYEDFTRLPDEPSFANVYEGEHTEVGWSWSSQRRWLPPAHYALDDGWDYQITARKHVTAWEGEALDVRLDASFTPSEAVPVQCAATLRAGWTNSEDFEQALWTNGVGPLVGLPRGYDQREFFYSRVVGGGVALRVPLGKRGTWHVDPRLIDHGPVLEFFADAVVGGNGDLRDERTWWRSAGLELHADWEFSDLRIQPTVGWATQFDGDQASKVYLSFGYNW